MANQDDELFKRLDESIKRNIAQAVEKGQTHELPKYYELRNFIGELRKRHDDLHGGAPLLKEKMERLQAQLDGLGQPPLKYGVYLGRNGGPGGQPATVVEKPHWQTLRTVVQNALRQEPSPAIRQQLEDAQKAVEAMRAQQSGGRQIVIGLGGQRFEVNLASATLDGELLRSGQQVVLNDAMNVVGVRGEHARGDIATVVNVLRPPGAARVILVPPDEMQAVRVELGERERKDIGCLPALRSQLRQEDIVQLDEQESCIIAKVRPRLQVRAGGSEGVVVEVADELCREVITIGDVLRVDMQLQIAFEKLPAYETSGLALEDVPDVSYGDIGGLDNQLELIQDAIELPYLHHAIFSEYRLSRPKGILLHGPPGCGKTMIAKAVASSLTDSIKRHSRRLLEAMSIYRRLSAEPEAALADYRVFCKRDARPLPDELTAAGAAAKLERELASYDIHPENVARQESRLREVLARDDGIRSFFLNIKGPELLNKYVGETEGRIRKLFDEAKRRASFHTPVVIFFDEMEAMFRTRGSGRSSDIETTIVPQFLAEMDGVESSENVIVIGATNRPDMIDPAILRPGRLDVKIEIQRPDRCSTLAILGLSLNPSLPLRAEGVKLASYDDPAAVAAAMRFKTHVIRQTLRIRLREMADVEKLVLTLPDGHDLRSALRESTALRELASALSLETRLRELAQQEQLAETLIVAITDLLFSPASHLLVLTTSGKRHQISLRHFIGGAMLTGIVARAKKAAVKRSVLRRGQEEGIGLSDLRVATLEEFQENAAQMATNHLERELSPKQLGQAGDSVQVSEVHLKDVKDNLFSIEKTRIYRQAKGA